MYKEFLNELEMIYSNHELKFMHWTSNGPALDFALVLTHRDALKVVGVMYNCVLDMVEQKTSTGCYNITFTPGTNTSGKKYLNVYVWTSDLEGEFVGYHEYSDPYTGIRSANTIDKVVGMCLQSIEVIIRDIKPKKLVLKDEDGLRICHWVAGIGDVTELHLIQLQSDSKRVISTILNIADSPDCSVDVVLNNTVVSVKNCGNRMVRIKVVEICGSKSTTLLNSKYVVDETTYVDSRVNSEGTEISGGILEVIQSDAFVLGIKYSDGLIFRHEKYGGPYVDDMTLDICREMAKDLVDRIKMLVVMGKSEYFVIGDKRYTVYVMVINKHQFIVDAYDNISGSDICIGRYKYVIPDLSKFNISSDTPI